MRSYGNHFRSNEFVFNFLAALSRYASHCSALLDFHFHLTNDLSTLSLHSSGPSLAAFVFHSTLVGFLHLFAESGFGKCQAPSISL